MVSETHTGFAYPIGAQFRPLPAGVAIRFTVRGETRSGIVFDYLPTTMFVRVRNMETFAGMLLIDKWTGNADGRQAAFWRRLRERTYTASFIDQGYCFNAKEWTFPDNPLRGVTREMKCTRA
jgi:hypothetical protein